MLHLARHTDDSWYDRIRDELDAVLIDHAHLEKRAASTALSMIFKYTAKKRLRRELSVVVREEMEHFELMLDVLDARDIEFTQLDAAPYARGTSPRTCANRSRARCSTSCSSPR